MRRLVFLLGLTTIIYFIRAMFDGTLGLKIFTGVLAAALSITWFYFKGMKTIKIEMF